MITLDELRSLLTSSSPWTNLDARIRHELKNGGTTVSIRNGLRELVEPVRNAVVLSEEADDALMDALDALEGNCAPKWRYQNVPTTNGVHKISQAVTV